MTAEDTGIAAKRSAESIREAFLFGPLLFGVGVSILLHRFDYTDFYQSTAIATVIGILVGVRERAAIGERASTAFGLSSTGAIFTGVAIWIANPLWEIIVAGALLVASTFGLIEAVLTLRAAAKPGQR
jgi:hypothetical protein